MQGINDSLVFLSDWSQGFNVIYLTNFWRTKIIQEKSTCILPAFYLHSTCVLDYLVYILFARKKLEITLKGNTLLKLAKGKDLLPQLPWGYKSDTSQQKSKDSSAKTDFPYVVVFVTIWVYQQNKWDAFKSPIKTNTSSLGTKLMAFQRFVPWSS